MRLKEFSSLYEVVKNERNKYVNLIQSSSQVRREPTMLYVACCMSNLIRSLHVGKPLCCTLHVACERPVVVEFCGSPRLPTAAPKSGVYI